MLALTKWKYTRWIVGGVLALVAFIALVLSMAKHKKIDSKAVALVEATHAPIIRAYNAHLTDLKDSIAENDKAIKNLEAAAAKKTAAITRMYNTTGMTAAEVKEKLEALEL